MGQLRNKPLFALLAKFCHKILKDGLKLLTIETQHLGFGLSISWASPAVVNNIRLSGCINAPRLTVTKSCALITNAHLLQLLVRMSSHGQFQLTLQNLLKKSCSKVWTFNTKFEACKNMPNQSNNFDLETKTSEKLVCFWRRLAKLATP